MPAASSHTTAAARQRQPPAIVPNIRGPARQRILSLPAAPPYSRRFGYCCIQMFQTRQHLVLEQRKRMMPGLRPVLVVKTKHEQHAKAADLVPDLLDLLGHGRGRADDPV